MNGMMTMMMNKCIPVEYVSNPIVEILKSTAKETHPQLPSPFDLFAHSRTMNDEESENLAVNFNEEAKMEAIESNVEHNNETKDVGQEIVERKVILLEQIVRSHPIWYLPHINRSAAVHLLRSMDQGAFIVRSSSKANTMAISIRLASNINADCDIDHYLIESFGTDRSVRLEFSPNSFRSLPILIEYYCINGAELQTCLRLPHAIANCRTSMHIQRIALMGQDFWTSDIAHRRKTTANLPENNSNNNNNNTKKMTATLDHRQSISRSSQTTLSDLVPQLRSSSVRSRTNVDTNNKVGLNKSRCDRRTSNVMLNQIHNRPFDQATGTVQDDLLNCDFKMHSSRYDEGIERMAARNTKGFHRNYINSNHNNGIGYQNSCTVVDVESQRKSNVMISRNHRKIVCGTQSTQSNSKTSENFSKTLNFSNDCDSRNCDNGAQDQAETSASTNASGVNSANCLRTFKPLLKSTSIAGSIQENMAKLNGLNLHHNAASIKPALKPKPIALRRERSDLTFNCASHLVNYADYNSGELIRKALIPPQACLDEKMMKNCLDELKRKNQQPPSVDRKLATQSSQQKQRSSTKAAFANEKFKSYLPVIFRQNSLGKTRKQQHRLSVPNLTELMQKKSSMGIGTNGNAINVKALKTRIGRNPGTGELQTINEGLITPVVRRKQYAANNVHVEAGFICTENASTSDLNNALYNNKSSSPAYKYKKEYPIESLINDNTCVEVDDDTQSETGAVIDHVFTRKFNSERCYSRGSTDRVYVQLSTVQAWKPKIDIRLEPERSENFASSLSESNNTISSISSQSKLLPHKNQRLCGGSFRKNFLNKQTNNAWSAVNTEMKTRQKIAKVRPTPQVAANKIIGTQRASRSSNYSLTSTMTSYEKSAASPYCLLQNQGTSSLNIGADTCSSINDCQQSPTKKAYSEYAQLSECLTETTSVTRRRDFDERRSGQEDDAISLAGTVFNEPWDSNVWENLLDLANYGDEPHGTKKQSDASATSCAAIIEEDLDYDLKCVLETSNVDGDLESNIVYEDSEMSGGKYTVHVRTKKKDTLNLVPQNSMEDVVNLSSLANSELSSKSSTCGSTKDASNSLMNISNVGHLMDICTSNGSNKTLNMHSLPRLLPRYSKVENSYLESIDDIPTSIRALSPVISPQRLKNSLSVDPETRIQDYVERLSQEKDTVFGGTLRRFIECTFEAEEDDPLVVVRNVRQFLNGMKNYLVKHGEGELHELIENERSRLNANEFLNIDAILEAVLHKVVLCPVKPHLYHLMVREHSKNGWLQSLSENISYVRKLSPEQLGFGFHTKFIPPNTQKMEIIKICLRKMQHHYSPLKKLENLLRVIFIAIGRHRHHYDVSPNGGELENCDPYGTNETKIKQLPPADELVRWLVYILCRTSTVGCEVEAWYMWGLLPKQLLTNGDSSYYLIALFSAIDVLKNADNIRKLSSLCNCTTLDKSSDIASSESINQTLSSCSDAFVKVAIPDELDGSIRYHTFPGVPQMTAGKLCRVIAHQFGITNPEDHGLYLLLDGYETCLLSNECPDLIRYQLRQAHKNYLFAYKRHEAKIAWPKVAVDSCRS